tara:strand:- start:83 stop:424 length:342 start_codon:yes stop_codon:yes gene_type:complete
MKSTQSIVTQIISTIITIIHNITTKITPQPINTPHTLSLLISKLNRLETQLTQQESLINHLQSQIQSTKQTQFRHIKKSIKQQRQNQIQFNNLIPNPKLDEIYQEQFPNNNIQ